MKYFIIKLFIMNFLGNIFINLLTKFHPLNFRNTIASNSQELRKSQENTQETGNENSYYLEDKNIIFIKVFSNYSETKTIRYNKNSYTPYLMYRNEIKLNSIYVTINPSELLP